MITSARPLRPISLPLVWLFFVLYAVAFITTIMGGRLGGPHAGIVLLGLVTASVGSLAFLVPALRRRPRLQGWIVAFFAFVTAWTSLVPGIFDYEPVKFNYGIQLCALLLITGRYVIAPVVASAAILLLGAISAVTDTIATGGSFVSGVVLAVSVVGYGAVMITGALAWLRFSATLASREKLFRGRTRRAIVETQRRERERARLRLKTALLDTGALSVTEELVDTDTITPALVLDMRVAEATLRDYLRGARLSHPLIEPEILAARRRGVEVLVLGEDRDNRSDGAAPRQAAVHTMVAERIVEVLREAKSGDRVTLSEQREHRGAEARSTLTVLVASPGGAAVLRRFSSTGELLDRG